MSGPREGAALLASMVVTRLELAALDLEEHAKVSLSALSLAVAAFVLSLVALTFVGVAVIAVFWDTHRIAAAAGTTGAYCLCAVVFVFRARARWRSRPAPFASAAREIELDRAALHEAIL